ncbi:MAG: hypothetical protein KatS3mg076_3105 [Candidatus Binatia bacterium]|nr:MAG: hypothetical protein KatS3mg076_3105 [Candidatus Binatia bacterium]
MFRAPRRGSEELRDLFAAVAGVATGLFALVILPASLRELPQPTGNPPGREVSLAPDPESWTIRVDGWVVRFGRAVEGLFRSPAPRGHAEALSPFDPLLRYHARRSGFDWRLLAALVFEESRFDPEAESDKGAYGLMQVRSVAAEEVGVEDFRSPAGNIEAGTQYLKRLSERFRRARGRQRLALVLAAYHMGPAHLEDAQKLAERLGFDPWRWDHSLELVLPLLEEPRFYSRLPHGYAKGRLTVRYVSRILDRYDYYRDRTDLPAHDDQAASASG